MKHETAGVHLLAYTDRLAGDLPGVRRVLGDGALSVFTGIHLLPFFVPFDGADAGFDPVDHTTVDPRLGSWSDLRRLSDADVAVTADLVVNHISAESAEFRDWLLRGADSPSDGMFLTFDTVFPEGAREADITAMYRPRDGVPFTPYQLADGSRRLVWTTFKPTQIDLDVHSPATQDYLRRILATLAGAGVRIVRLDALGYAVKTPGTDSFLTEHTLAFTEQITAAAREVGLQVLVELHGHHTQQQTIAPLVDFVYDFALPPLLLHAFGTGEVEPLVHWVDIRPGNAVTVLDTHDGIGVVDAGPAGERPGLLDHDQMAALFEQAALTTRGESAVASHRVAWASLPHQINSTFFSVLGADPHRMTIARAVQLFLPGLPQVYYVGLLGGRNDMQLFAATGEGRDVNRHRYPPAELAAALDSEVTRAQLALVAIRTRHPAFAGEFDHAVEGRHRLALSWTNGVHRARLQVGFGPGAPTFRLELHGRGGAHDAATTPAELVEIGRRVEGGVG